MRILKEPSMTSYIKNYSPLAQLVIFVGLFLGMWLVYTLVFLGFLMPHYTGVTIADLQDISNITKPHILNTLKIMQLVYSCMAFFLPGFLFLYLYDEKPMHQVGMNRTIRWSWIGWAVLLLALALPFVGVLSDWNEHLHFGALDQSIRSMEQQADIMVKAMLVMPNGWVLLYNLILIAFIPAICEEVFFRGVFQKLLIQWTKNEWLGIFFTGVFFSLLHGEMLGFFPRILLGMILGLIYVYSGNLWYAIGAHFFNNGIQVVLMYLFQIHWISYDISKDQPTPVWAGLISLVLIIILVLYLRRIRIAPAWSAAKTPSGTEPS